MSNTNLARKSVTPHKVSAAPKNTEWGIVGRTVGVTMTSMLQRMGKAEVTQANPQLVFDNTKVKILKILYDDTIRTSKKIVSKTNHYIGSVQHVKESLTELTNYYTTEHFTGKSIDLIVNIHNDISSFREKQQSSITNRYLLPAEAFITTTLTPARDAKKRFRKARLEYDSALSKLKMSQSQSNIDLKQLYLAQSHYAKYKLRYLHRQYEAQHKLSDTVQRHSFEYLVQSINLLASLHDYYSNVCSQLNAVEPTIKEMREYSAKQKKTNTDNRQDQQLKLYEISREKEENKYNEIVEIFSSPDLAVVNAICLSAGSEQEIILEDLVRILDAHKQTLPIIKLGITKEISSTSSASTLFRGNSTPTKLMTSFTRMTGRPYLISTLKPIIDKLLKDPSGYELDPEKTSDTTGNVERLTSICQEFLNDIYNSIATCPLPFREMANHLQNEVVKVFPESKHTSVGGFIFLRFFCPCILSPDSCGLTDTASLTMEARRALILVSKTLQNLANGLPFGSKETFMKDMNPFLERNMESCREFLDKIAEMPSNTDYKPLSSISEVKSKELPSIHKLLIKNLEKIFKTLCQYNQQSVTFQLVSALGKLGESEP
ncbi:Ras GTPase activation domain-containing protein [Tieghemostelium lacteum]|uniref:Ras GTPase activation domain-containing protein n=1 Tax=Tieghemostelium lacteum TaxID=361077 RepID=A0A151Z2V1_TIELA|nr:Ras GTPase activation domain-containing protein [Tieghemostelium lacteum]|eukprot:KYQ88285.1 Ras GTPase activation domain-containing protein [Tieghemostelium lacteum]